MKITLELFEDCSEYDPNDLDSAHWQLKVDDKSIGKLNTYKELHATLDYILDMEELLPTNKT